MELRVRESTGKWYAVLTRSRQEKIAARTLEALGIRHFLPLHAEKRQWSDRIQLIHAPLFPGYLFVHLDTSSSSRLDVLKAPGVARFIGDHAGPSYIDDSEIEQIRAVTSCGVEPCA